MDHICNESCRARPTCTVCRQRKAPTGRDPGAMSHCAEECPGHYAAPHPGHLWPGEECYGPGHKYGTDCPACVAERTTDLDVMLRDGA